MIVILIQQKTQTNGPYDMVEGQVPSKTELHLGHYGKIHSSINHKLVRSYWPVIQDETYQNE